MNPTPVFLPADILLPTDKDSRQRSRWSVVACDQFTSEPDYWSQVEAYVADAPSTYKITLPEVYLEQPGVEERIAGINAAMDRYLEDGVLTAYPDSFFYLERTLRNGKIRRGLVGMVDLEQYNYLPGSQSMIRATEGTVLDRIPPRVRVRKNAALELPHVMILIDDPDNTVIGPLDGAKCGATPGAEKSSMEEVYHFPLMQDSGSVQGWRLGERERRQVLDALAALSDPDAFRKKYGLSDAGEKGVLLFAVGDGNHSLATAKECYEQLKKTLSPQEAAVHPARYALVEVVNVHDASLDFEPIHRIVFDVNPDKMLADLKEYYEITSESSGAGQQFWYVKDGQPREAYIQNPSSNLAVGSIQRFLDSWLKENGGRVDYIHGEEVVENLSRQPDTLGFLFPAMAKSELFPTVILDGALPRKTFSMGHAWDKRFYLECRRLKK